MDPKPSLRPPYQNLTAKRKAWILANKKRIQEVSRRHRIKNAANIAHARYLKEEDHRNFMAWIKDQPCADCGKKFPACAMDFDHRDPATKLASVSFLSR